MKNGSGPLLAESKPHPPWPFWRKVIAYLLMFMLASLSIWLVDRLSLRVMFDAG